MNDLRSNAFPKLKRDISHNSFKSISYKPLNKQVIKINNPTNNINKYVNNIAIWRGQFHQQINECP